MDTQEKQAEQSQIIQDEIYVNGLVILGQLFALKYTCKGDIWKHAYHIMPKALFCKRF